MNPSNHQTPDFPHRRSIRLKEYDYAQAGAYFITICTHNHKPIFGKIELRNNEQPVGAGLAPAQNGIGQPPGFGQPQGLPLQDSNNAIMGADIGHPVGAGLAPAQNGIGQPPGSGQPRGLPLQDSNNVIIGAGIGQPVGAGLAPAQNGIGQPPGSGQPRGLPQPNSNNACAQMELNEFGQIALEQWYKLADRFPNIEPDAFVVMPNHVHGIIFITENGQPVGAGLTPAQNGIGQPPGSGQPRGLARQDSNYACAQMELNEFGQIALEQWYKLADRFPNIELDAFVVMPNHVHGIIFITENWQPVGAGLAPAQNGIGQPRDGQPQGSGQPRGLPLQDSNNAIMGADIGQPPGSGQPRGLPLQDLNNANMGADIGQPQGLPLPMRVTLGDIVGAYKSLVSNECLKICKTKNKTLGKLWQRNYYEHIIRDEKSYENIVYYIENNPSTWQQDELFRGETL